MISVILHTCTNGTDQWNYRVAQRSLIVWWLKGAAQRSLIIWWLKGAAQRSMINVGTWCRSSNEPDTAESSRVAVQRNMCKDSNELIPLKVARAQSVLGLNESIPLKVAESLFKGTRVKTQWVESAKCSKCNLRRFVLLKEQSMCSSKELL